MCLPRRTSLLAAALLLVSLASLRAQTAANISGHWEGKIKMPNQDVDMTVDLSKGPTGAWIGSINFPGSTDVPLGNITVDGDTTVRFTASLPGRSSFESTLSADASSLSGKASNAEGAVPFALMRNGEARVKVPPPSSRSSKEFEGTWEGAIDVGGTVRRVVLKLSPAADGTATATLISVDKGNLEIPVTTVTLQDKLLQLDARSVGGTYRGTLGAGGDIAGEWSEGSTRLPLSFKRAAK